MRLARTIPVDDLPRDIDGRLAFYAWPGQLPILYHDETGAPLHPWCAEGRTSSTMTWSIFLEGAPVRCTACRGEYRSAYGLLS